MPNRPLVLNGKVAIVTGANQGLGLEIARRYVDAGASVVLCARDTELLNVARETVAKASGPEQRVETVAADVTNDADVQRVVDRALALGGRIDILVNSAGIY